MPATSAVRWRTRLPKWRIPMVVQEVSRHAGFLCARTEGMVSPAACQSTVIARRALRDR